MHTQQETAHALCLASVSPRRRELLQQIGVSFCVRAPNIDEAALPAEAPADYVLRMARTKAQTVRAQGTALPVLAADTIVLIDALILGKPAGAAEGVAMLERLAGRTHEVLTAVALATDAGLTWRLSTSAVRLRALSRAECIAYWSSGEPHDKAGAYAIQGRGAVFIEHLSGSYSGVMGLPLYETAQLLAAAGVPCWLAGVRLHEAFA
jgi:septum formation protein